MRIENVTNINSNGEVVNMASEESVTLLRKIVKMMESNTVVDPQMRQRVVVDGTMNSYPQTYPIGSSVSNTPTIGLPSTSATVYYQPTWSGPIDPRWTNIEQARISYNTGIRNNLIFT